MGDQLELFTPAAAPAERPVWLVTVCPWCGAHLEAVEADAGDSWMPGVLWGYVAQARHNDAHHPDRRHA